MTSVHLNPPSSAFLDVELKEEHQLQLFLSPHQASASLSLQSPFFNSTSQEFPTGKGKLAGSHHQYDHHHHHQVDEYTTPIKRSNGQNKLPSTSLSDTETSHDHKCCNREEHCRDQLEGTRSDGSIKCMPAKMRLDEPENHSSTCSKTIKPVRLTVKFQDHHQYHSKECNSACSNNSTRVCSDCNTTTTPLWRSGPQGPKSLCNACGIRQRKARRAIAATAAAANGGVIAMEASSIKTKVHKEKKSRSSHAGQCKKVCNKLIDHPLPSFTSQKQLCFKNFAKSLSKSSALQQVFPRDVEEAAVLLMELSCGFIHC